MDDPKNWKTVLKIPFERAPEAPAWMYKARTGKRMDPIEVEEFYHYKYNKDFEDLRLRPNYDGIPSHAQIINAIRKYHVFKKKCLMSFYDC